MSEGEKTLSREDLIAWEITCLLILGEKRYLESRRKRLEEEHE